MPRLMSLVPRVTFYPGGGHMGNLHLEEIQNNVMNSIQDLL